MNKELPVIPNNELPANTTQTTFSQVGNDNIQVAHANNVNTVIIMTPALTTAMERRPVPDSRLAMNITAFL